LYIIADRRRITARVKETLGFSIGVNKIRIKAKTKNIFSLLSLSLLVLTSFFLFFILNHLFSSLSS
jgi:hypothetical protein